MNVGGKHYRAIWLAEDGETVEIIDQTCLPHNFSILQLHTLEDAANAIKTMQVRGAPLIGAAAAYGVCLAVRQNSSDEALEKAYNLLIQTRPTAINLRWALDDMKKSLLPLGQQERVKAAYRKAQTLCDEDVVICQSIGEHGAGVINKVWESVDRIRPVNILTHCNAGWLATVDWGTATSPIYVAHNEGIPIHVWVDETRPRNQGAGLTAWELGQHGVPHTVIVDNAGGHIMQQGEVDLMITGTDRTTANGDVANKIGTYLKALAAHDNDVPFYVGLPGPTIDWNLTSGKDIPIEERDTKEVTTVTGLTADGQVKAVKVTPEASKAANYAFDVTPARLVTGLITERGICDATQEGLLSLYPENGLKA
ncbi:MAG: S-methyl-5-thioribose-1-phosphate isomerase [Pseudomonadota bacterium]|nr:S-methyl-5-thioribose-1-phosphate isomerase [Pseudomonadota bacterium]